MSFVAFLNHWWNLPFLVMLGLCGVFFVLQAIGLLGGDADHDVDTDTDVDQTWMPTLTPTPTRLAE